MKINIVGVSARTTTTKSKYLRLISENNHQVSVFLDSDSWKMLQDLGYSHLANLQVSTGVTLDKPICVEVDRLRGYYTLTAVHTPYDAAPTPAANVTPAPRTGYDKTVRTGVAQHCYSIMYSPTLTALHYTADVVTVCQLTAFNTVRVHFNAHPVSDWGVLSSHLRNRQWFVWDTTPEAELEQTAAQGGLPPFYPVSVTCLMPIFARYVGKWGATIPQALAFATFGVTPATLMGMVAERDKASFPPLTPALTQTMSILAVLKAMASNTPISSAALAELEATNA